MLYNLNIPGIIHKFYIFKMQQSRNVKANEVAEPRIDKKALFVGEHSEKIPIITNPCRLDNPTFDNPEIAALATTRVQADSADGDKRCSRGALRRQGRSLECATKMPGWERVERGRRASVVAVVSTLRRPGRGRETDFSASSGRSPGRGRARVRICARVPSGVLCANASRVHLRVGRDKVCKTLEPTPRYGRAATNEDEDDDDVEA